MKLQAIDQPQFRLPGGIRITKVLGQDAGGNITQYEAVQLDADGEPAKTLILGAWDLPPSELEVTDEHGTLDMSVYRIANKRGTTEPGWILPKDRGARLGDNLGYMERDV